MLIPICHHCYKPLPNSTNPAECCKCYTPCPDGVINTTCVKYNLFQPEAQSELECLGNQSGDTLYKIILEIYRRILNRIRVQDTDTMDLKFECGILSMNVRMDPASTIPWSIGPYGLKLDCCFFDCSSIVFEFDFEITEVDRLSDFYYRQDDSYFCLSDTITGIHFTDNSFLTGDVLSYVTYTDYLNQGTYTFYQFGASFVMPVSICANSLKGIVKTFLFEAYTKKGCYVYKECDFNIERVNFTERIATAYRFNAQMNDMPVVSTPGVNPLVDRGVLYYADTLYLDNASSKGAVIKKIYLNHLITDTMEIRSIAGSPNISNIQTLSNKWGDQIQYDYASSINIDSNEIHNEEPVLYFASFNGCVVRLVKERNTECDERANWKSYVIAGKIVNGVNIMGSDANDVIPQPNNSISADEAVFTKIYGIKKWYPINGKPSFMVKDAFGNFVQYLYYSGNGNVNDSINWIVKNLRLRGIGVASNINVEVSPLAADNGKLRLWIFGNQSNIPLGVTGAIRIITFPVLNPTLSDLLDPFNYTGANVRVVEVNGAAYTWPNTHFGTFPNTFDNVKLWEPNFIQRIDDGANYYYLMGTENFRANPQIEIACNPSQPCNTGNLIGDLFKIVESATPVGPASYTVSKLMDTTANPLVPNSTKGTFSTQCNAKFVQGFFKDLQGNWYDFAWGGIREYDFQNNEIIGFPASVTNFNDTKLHNSNFCCESIVTRDTQYRYNLDCDTSVCEVPLLTIINNTGTSLTIIINNYNVNNSYDLSIDGGISFPYVGITNPYVVVGLAPNSNYTIVVIAHCGLNDTATSIDYPITTPPVTALCDPFYFTINGLTQTSFIASIVNPVFGDIYSLSIDNGATYIINNVTNPNIIVSGLTPGTTYNVVIKKLDSNNLICYSNYSVKTLDGRLYCVEVQKNYISGSNYNIFIQLKDQSSNAVNALTTLTFPLYLYSPSLQTYTPITLTISAGLSSGNLVVQTTSDSIICYDPSQYVNCANTTWSSNINNPCFCNVSPCPCLGCIRIVDLGPSNNGTGQILQFIYQDCYGNLTAVAPYDITINFTCGTIPNIVTYTAVIPQGSSSVTNNYLLCNIANIAIINITNNMKICHLG
jgi:hypothetical protein